jgi:hypothetical protein
MNWKKPGARLILAMTALCLSLDALTVFGGQTASGVVGHAMCVLRPLGFFAKFLFANEWSQLISDYCGTFPREPAISIIALMLKISVVALSLILTIAMFPLREGSPEDSADTPSEKHGVPVTGLAGWIPALVIFLLPTILGWRWLITSASPQEFHTDLIDKAYEDIFLLSSYVGGIILWAAICELALLPVLRRLFPNKDWIRPST